MPSQVETLTTYSLIARQGFFLILNGDCHDKASTIIPCAECIGSHSPRLKNPQNRLARLCSFPYQEPECHVSVSFYMTMYSYQVHMKFNVDIARARFNDRKGAPPHTQELQCYCGSCKRSNDLAICKHCTTNHQIWKQTFHVQHHSKSTARLVILFPLPTPQTKMKIQESYVTL